METLRGIGKLELTLAMTNGTRATSSGDGCTNHNAIVCVNGASQLSILRGKLETQCQCVTPTGQWTY